MNLFLLAAETPGEAQLFRVAMIGLALCGSLVLSSAFLVYLLCPGVPKTWTWPEEDPEGRA